MEENQQHEKQKSRRKLLLPRWAVPFVWAVIVLIIQVLLPWAVGRFGSHFGWSGTAPTWWNLIGLGPIVIGLGAYAWCLVFHFRSYDSAVRVGYEPPHLVDTGPYRFSRNPMYVSGLFVWFGWAIYYGSPAVAVTLVLLWAIFAFRVIPYEERQLEALFGDEYLRYKRSVRRWIGRGRSVDER